MLDEISVAPSDAGMEHSAAWTTLRSRLEALYGADAARLLRKISVRCAEVRGSRDAELSALDDLRSGDPQWIAQSGQAVYSFYVDRFAGSLDETIDHLDDLRAMGVRWLHPLPILRPREGDSDGGFAVQDYRAIDPAIGDMAALRRLTRACRERDMGLIVDIVCNHTAREHVWAEQARRGDPRYRAYYHFIETEAQVLDWERTLIDVFPQTAPGSFTYDEALGTWVWTTFYPFQWDLNYANPDVFYEMLDVLFFLTEAGVQGFRLDSAPFLWKRLGTSCRNQPEAYAIVEAFRAALDLAAPGVILLAEAIEGVDDVLPFFGQDVRGCDLAYNNGVMTALWASLADGDTAIARRLLAETARRPEGRAWLNYVRCHDDLIWSALADFATPDDMRRWSRFFDGQGYSSGQRFQSPPGGIDSTNGMTAALVGVGHADVDQDAALGRLRLLYGVVFALDGWPLVYMGDEIALGNDEQYRHDPVRRDEGRWLHRPKMDWDRHCAARTEGEGSVAYQAIVRCATAARRLNAWGVSGRALPVETEHPGVLAFRRVEGWPFLCVANFTDQARVLRTPDGFEAPGVDLLTGETVAGSSISLEPYQVIWRTLQP